MRRIAFLCALIALSIGWVGAQAQERLFADDPRLAQPVALRTYYDTLDTTVSGIAARSRVTLTVDDAVKPLAVCAVADATTVRESMELLAAACGLVWRRTGEAPDYAYELYRDLQGRSAIAERRAAHWRQAASELESHLASVVRFGTRFERMEARLVRDELLGLRETAEALPTGKERLTAEQDVLCATIAASPIEWPLVLAYRALPGEAHDRLMRGERVLISSVLPGALPMPERLRVALSAGRATLAQRERTPPLVDPGAPETVEIRAQMLGERVFVRVRAPRHGNQPRAPSLAMPVRQLTPSHAEFFSPPLDRSGKVSADNPADLAKSTTFQLLARKRTRGDVLTHPQGLTPAEILRSWHEQNPALKVVGASPWIALTYTRGPTPQSARAVVSGLGRGARPPIGRLLTEVASRGRLDIHLRRDGWITFRTTTPYDWEHESIDPKWLSETFGDVAEGTAAFGPSVAQRAARGLTPEQARTLGDFELGYLMDVIAPGELARNHAFWRLAAQLPRREPATLLSGTALRYSALGPVGKKAFREFLLAVSLEGDGPMDLELSGEALNYLELSCAETPATPKRPMDPAFAARGSYRSIELRLTRPPISLLRQSACCHWE